MLCSVSSTTFALNESSITTCQHSSTWNVAISLKPLQFTIFFEFIHLCSFIHFLLFFSLILHTKGICYRVQSDFEGIVPHKTITIRSPLRFHSQLVYSFFLVFFS